MSQDFSACCRQWHTGVWAVAGLSPGMWQHTEGRTAQQLSFASTRSCPVPLWVSCWSGSQHHLSRRLSSISPISNHALEALCAHASHQPASCCPQLTLLQNPHQWKPGPCTTTLPAGSAPHPWQLPCLSLSALSLLTLCISFFTTMTSSTLLTFKGERKETHVRNPRPSISPVHKLYCCFLLTQPDVQCCSLVNNLLDLTCLRQHVTTDWHASNDKATSNYH